jgi:hypothetical protein
MLVTVWFLSSDLGSKPLVTDISSGFGEGGSYLLEHIFFPCTISMESLEHFHPVKVILHYPHKSSFPTK